MKYYEKNLTLRTKQKDIFVILAKLIILIVFNLTLYTSMAFGDDYGNSCINATTVSVNSTINGNIEDFGDYDYFEIYVPSNGTLNIYTTGNTDTKGYLNNYNCNQIYSDNDSYDGTNFNIQYVVLPGTYFIAVSPATMSVVGSYILHIELLTDDHGNDCPEATYTNLTGSIGGFIEQSNDRDYFEVNVPLPGTLSVSTTSDIELFLNIRDLDCNTVFQGPSVPSNITVTPGNYYIAISSENSSIGIYTLNTDFESSGVDDHGNTCSQATPISVNDNVSGTIETVDDSDFFNFQIPLSGTIEISASSDFDNEGFLFNSNCIQIADDDDSGDNKNFKITEDVDPGAYYVKVAGYGSYIGNYNIYVQFTPNNSKPEASSTDISGQPVELYADQEYSISAKYFDRDGRGDLQYCYFKLGHPNANDLILIYNQNNGSFMPAPGNEGDDYISLIGVDVTNITEGMEGINLTWTFKIKTNWTENEGGIFFGVSAVDDTGQESGWSLDNSNSSFFKLQPAYSPTILGGLAEIANIRGLFGTDPVSSSLQGQYIQGKKSVAYFSAQTILGISIYIDICDYYSALHPNDAITGEGAEGWITVWIDGQVGLAAGATPAGLGILQIPFEASMPDPPRRWDFNEFGLTIPFFEANSISWSEDGVNFGQTQLTPNTEISANVFNLGFSVALRFEIQKDVLDSIINYVVTQGLTGGALTGPDDMISASVRLVDAFVEYEDGWRVKPKVTVKYYTKSDNNDAVVDGCINHIRGGGDINGDGIPDNFFPIMPTFFGIPYAGHEFYVTFQNIGTDTGNFFIKYKDDLPAGWSIGSVDDNGIIRFFDGKIDLIDVPPAGSNGTFVITRWGVSASNSAPETAEITFELYKDEIFSNELLEHQEGNF